MSFVFSTAEKAAIAAEARKMVASGAHHEAAISFLSEHGFDKLECEKALVLAGIPVAASAQAVHLSPTRQSVPTRGVSSQDDLRLTHPP